MDTRNISIAKDFSRFPAGRYESDGKFPGEVCRRRLLVPNLKTGANVVVDLRGTLGYGSSFLEEAFGGLIREEGFSIADLRRQLSFISDDDTLQSEIWSYIEAADAASSKPAAAQQSRHA
jgi:hypothetical protein